MDPKAAFVPFAYEPYWVLMTKMLTFPRGTYKIVAFYNIILRTALTPLFGEKLLGNSVEFLFPRNGTDCGSKRSDETCLHIHAIYVCMILREYI